MTSKPKAPIIFWIIAAVALLWNLMGAFDYVMTETHNQSYMARFTPEQLDYFTSFPAWFVALWAVAVWGGVLASVLFLLRRALAVSIFMYSFLAMVVTAVYSYGLTSGLEVMGTEGLVFSIVIFVVSLGLWQYARYLQGKGILT